MKENINEIKRIVESKEAIIINNHFIKRVLGFDDMRDFFQSIGDWGYSHDFTYKDKQTEDFKTFFHEYLKENYLD